jgi:hypothetical protein
MWVVMVLCAEPDALCLTQQLSVGYVSGQKFKLCC